ncbi:MAG: HDIG domain-containing protein [Candidatus Marinimicrobia bacterium]|nr:HDIG domain-containing protein [Candidatus Neomarinimicrobiota bacterium]
MNFLKRKKTNPLNKEDKKNLTKRILIFTGLTLILSLFFPHGKYLEYNYEINDITKEKILAEFDFYILRTEEELQADEDQVIRKTPFLFHKDRNITTSQTDVILTFLDDMENIHKLRKRYENRKLELFQYRFTPHYEKFRSYVVVDSAALAAAEEGFKNTYPFDLTAPEWSTFLDKQQISEEEIDYQEFSDNILQICRNRWGEGIFDITRDEIKSDLVGVVLTDAPELIEPNDINDLEKAWTKAKKEITAIYSDEEDVQREVGYQVIVEYMTPNVIYDRETTERRQQEKIRNIPTHKGMIMNKERIVDANIKVTPKIYQKLQSYKHKMEERAKLERGFGTLLLWIGRVFLVAVILSFFFSFLFTYRSSLFNNNKILLLFSSQFVLLVVLAHVFVNIVGQSEYLIPITVVAIVCTVLFDARIAVMSIVTLSILIAFIIGSKLDFVIISLFSSVAAIYAVRHLRTRAQLFVTILYIVVSGIIAMTAVGVLTKANLQSLRIDYLSFIVSGILAPLVAYGLSVLFEILFDVTSDLTLLELSDFNHPLLKRLSQEANGTFNHCVVVGNMAESSATAVGANPLLCRVGAYYHDIGKLKRPEYYIENQFSGKNPHDNLTPTLSARIIESHVKDGIKLANEYRLPKVIADFIPMHHGTCRIEYFYQKAVKAANNDFSKVNDNYFRYAGPKPNTKETGILMICEAVEAAVRSIKNPSLHTISAMVDKITEKRLKEGQLDDCPLTMRDLTKLKGNIRGKNGLIPILRGIYHLRIEYPDAKKEPSTKKKTVTP